MTRRHRNARIQCLDPYAELCELIERWVIYDLKSATGGLGYPRKSLDFTMIYSPASSIDPTGYSAEDHGAVAKIVATLSEADPKLFAAVAMYYKPWMIESFKERGFPTAPDQTFYNRLVRAHAWMLSELMDVAPEYMKRFHGACTTA